MAWARALEEQSSKFRRAGRRRPRSGSRQNPIQSRGSQGLGVRPRRCSARPVILPACGRAGPSRAQSRGSRAHRQTGQKVRLGANLRIAMMADGPRSSRLSALNARQPVRTEGALAHGSHMRRAVRGDDEQICGARLDGCGAVAQVREEPPRSRLHDASVDLPCEPAACPGKLADVLVLNGRLGSTVSTFQRCGSTGQIRWRTKPGDRPA